MNRTTQDQFSSLFERLPDGFCLTDRTGNLLYMNPAAERMLEVSRDALKGRRLCELLCSHIEEALPGGGCPLLVQDGGELALNLRGPYEAPPAFEWKGFRVAPLPLKRKDLRVRCLKLDGREAGHLIFIEDATRELELERQKEDWRSMVAHDLKAPLSSVLGVVAALKEQPGLEPDARQMAGIALEACRRMADLIQTYLELARLDSKTMRAANIELDLGRIVDRCAREQSAAAAGRGIRIDNKVPKSLKAKGDPELAGRVLENVLSNAVKYDKEGGRIELSSKARGGQVQVTVSDDGPGIEPEDLPRIFDRYYQAKMRRAGHLLGTGLGLAFCAEALKAMGGSIRAESEPGKGSAFTLSLPCA